MTPQKQVCAALYARVSTTEQSVDAQLVQLREYAERAGWTYDEFVDIGISGAKKGRPGLARMMKEVRKRKYKYLVVAAFDRYARSVSHLVQTLEELEHLNVDFISLREQINTASSMGKVVFHIIAAVAQLERDIIRERTVQGLIAAKKRGSRVGGLKKNWDKEHAVMLRKKGTGMRKIARMCNVGIGTVYRYFDEIGDPLKKRGGS